MKIVTIRQVDGRRYVGLSQEDAIRVRRDPALIDGVRPIVIVDADRAGRLSLIRGSGPAAEEVFRYAQVEEGH